MEGTRPGQTSTKPQLFRLDPCPVSWFHILVAVDPPAKRFFFFLIITFLGFSGNPLDFNQKVKA